MHMYHATVVPALISPHNQASYRFLVLGQLDSRFIFGCSVCGWKIGGTPSCASMTLESPLTILYKRSILLFDQNIGAFIIVEKS